MGGQDCDGSTLPQAPIGSLPIRSDGLPCPSPTDDDRQISSEDRRSVKLRVRPPPAGTHQCHRATSAGSGMMLTVKLRLAAVVDAQHGGFATGWSPVSWGSIDELFVNLTMPVRRPRGRVSEPSAWSRSSFTVLPDRTVGREHWPKSRSVQVHSAAARGFPHIAVPSPSHIPLACRAHQSECGRTPPARGRHHEEEPSP